LTGAFDDTVRLWNPEHWNIVGEPLEGKEKGAASVAYSLDGKRIIAASYDKSLRIWDAESGKALREPWEGHAGPIASVAFSPDSKRFISGGADHTVRLWHAETGNPLGKPFEGHTESVTSVAFLDDRRFVSVSKNQTLRIWDSHAAEEFPVTPETNAALYADKYHRDRELIHVSVVCLTFSPQPLNILIQVAITWNHWSSSLEDRCCVGFLPTN
jgi:WD40 repeat protein